MCPKLCILCIFPADCKLSKANQKTTIYCLLQAKHTTAKFWKSTNEPSLQVWLAGLLDSLVLEKLTFMIKGKYFIFDTMWRSFMTFSGGKKHQRQSTVQLFGCLFNVLFCPWRKKKTFWFGPRVLEEITPSDNNAHFGLCVMTRCLSAALTMQWALLCSSPWYLICLLCCIAVCCECNMKQ